MLPFGGWPGPLKSLRSSKHAKTSLCGPPAVLREAKERATQITESAGLWELEARLGEQRRRIDHDFDYRYSVLPQVFAALLRDGRLTEDDLHGFETIKLDAICHMARS
jgi:hypothetical protein